MIDLVGNKSLRNKVMAMCFVLGMVFFGIAWAAEAYDMNSQELLMLPGGMIAFSFVGCWVLIILAKLILTPLLQREEDYYQKGNDDPDA